MNKQLHVWRFAILAILLILSESIAVSSLRSSAVNASIAAEAPGSGVNNSDLLQYEWPQFQGDSSFNRISAGPAPEAPDILWKTNITGIQSYLSAFNGMVFAANSSVVFALDKETGSLVWNTTVPSIGRWPAVYKIDNTHMVVGSSCLDIATGKVLWTSANFSPNIATFGAGAYSPEEKMFYVKIRSMAQGWNFSDPSSPPSLEWETYVPGGGSIGSGVQYGDGKVFPGSFESHQMALDSKTGEILWDTETKGPMSFAGTYYQGKFLKGSPYDNTFYAFDANSGNILWTFSPKTYDGYFTSGSAAAYGMVYALNKDGYLYALDVETGKPAWTYKGPGLLFFPGNPVIADGKVYATTGQQSAKNPHTGEFSRSEFSCLDAYTGKVIWQIPIEAYPPRESTAIAYGNLYLIPAYVLYEQMDDYVTLDQVWAIGTRSWSMFRHDAANTGVGQSGPTNLTFRWNFSASGAVVSSPVAAYGKVYFGSQDKNVYAVDAWRGSLLWKFNTSNRILSSLAVANGKVYVGPDDGYVYSLDASNGSLIWSRYVGGPIPTHFSSMLILHSSPIVTDGRVYIGTLDNSTCSLDAETGEVKWTFPTKGIVTSTPAVANGVVYVESREPASGTLYALDASTGSLIWNMSLPYQQASRGTDLLSSPAVGGGMVFAATNKQAYYGINATNGKIVWTYKDPDAGEFIVCSPVYVDGKVYLVDEFFIVSLDALNGTVLWRSFLGAELYVSPSYADGKLYVTSDERGLYVVNATNGEKLSYASTPSNSWSAPSLYEGKMYVGNNDWNVYCFSEHPALNSSLTVELALNEIVLGESVGGSGNLIPEFPNASLTVSYVRPDGTVVNRQITTGEKGAFAFAYEPDVTGNWTVVVQWQSDRGYYDSTYSELVPLKVEAPKPPGNGGDNTDNALPREYIYAIATIAVIVIIVAALTGYFIMKRSKHK